MLNTIPYPTVENIYGIQISDLANNGQIKGIKYLRFLTFWTFDLIYLSFHRKICKKNI